MFLKVMNILTKIVMGNIICDRAVKSVILPHYLVELYLGKRRRPKLNVNFDPILKPPLSSFENNFSPICYLNLSLENTGQAIAKYVGAVFLSPHKLIKDLKLVTISVEQFPHMKNMSFLPEQIAWNYTNAGARMPLRFSFNTLKGGTN